MSTNTPITLTLTGRVVPKARPKHHGRQVFLPPKYREWKDSAISELLSQRTAEPIEKAMVTIEIIGSARGDLDNLAGAILDALVQAGILKDDRIACVPELTIRHRPKGAPGARVTLIPIDH